MMYNFHNIRVQLTTGEVGTVDESCTILSTIDDLLKHPVWIDYVDDNLEEIHTCGVIRKILSYEVE